MSISPCIHKIVVLLPRRKCLVLCVMFVLLSSVGLSALWFHPVYTFKMASSSKTDAWTNVFQETNLTEAFDPGHDPQSSNRKRDLVKSHPNFPPHLFLSDVPGKKPLSRKLCERFPSILGIAMSNGIFQVAFGSFGSLHIRTCHMDFREQNGPVIRCLAFLEPDEGYYVKAKVRSRVLNNLAIFNLTAQFWSGAGESVGTSQLDSTIYPTARAVVDELGFSVTLNFPIFKQLSQKVTAVSLRESSRCGGLTNVVKVHHQLPLASKPKFVVCLKDVFLPFEDQSLHLIEWIEMQRILGASLIMVHTTGEFQHPNVTKVLRYYEEKKLLSLRRATWPGKLSWPTEVISSLFPLQYFSRAWWLREELIFMNLQACLLDSIGRFQYMVNLDLDELILPTAKEHKSWHDMVEGSTYTERTSNNSTNVSSYKSFCYKERQMIADADLPHFREPASLKWPHGHENGHSASFLTQTHSTRPFTDVKLKRRKCFTNLEDVVQPHMHGPHVCIVRTKGNNVSASTIGRCNNTIDASIYSGRSFHYRSHCRSGSSGREKNLGMGKTIREHQVDTYPCSDSSAMSNFTFHKDTTVLKYAEELRSAVTKALQDLSFT